MTSTTLKSSVANGHYIINQLSTVLEFERIVPIVECRALNVAIKQYKPQFKSVWSQERGRELRSKVLHIHCFKSTLTICVSTHNNNLPKGTDRRWHALHEEIPVWKGAPRRSFCGDNDLTDTTKRRKTIRQHAKSPGAHVVSLSVCHSEVEGQRTWDHSSDVYF